MRLCDQAANYEDVAGLQTIGQSLEGTDMIVIQICRGGDCNNGKPDMYIEGGIHARQEQTNTLIQLLFLRCFKMFVFRKAL